MTGSPAASGALPMVAPGHAVSRARTAALIAGAGLAVYLAFVAAMHRVFLFPLAAVAPFFLGLILLNLFLAATADVWFSWRRAVYALQAVQVVVATIILHRLGGVMMGALMITYAFPIILAEMFDTSTFGIANLAAASYAMLAWFERGQLREVGIGADQQIGFVVLAFLAFNCLALYTNRYSYQLRHLNRHLGAKVAERTAALTAANAELAAKARALEAKQDELRNFVYTVTHDLKAPVNAILLTADMLLARQGPALGADGREELERIVRLAGGTEDMIRDLLELFRITSVPEAPARVDLAAVTRAAVETLQPRIAAKRATVHVNGLPPVRGEPRKLARVLANLLDNAVKYVPAGRGRIDVTGAVADGEVVLSVRDNGIGIPAAYRRAIFELFGRVPDDEQLVDGEAVSGSGVGLTAVKRIVETHGGTVSVESTPGAGSCFTVRLPAEGA